jgi:RNA polymerase sigma factor (sigma-70 family)
MPHVRTTLSESPSQSSSPSSSSPSDWEDLLAGVTRGDAAALHRVTALITGYLARSGAFDLRDSWADIIQEVLSALIHVARRGGLRDPAALVGYALAVTRSKVNDWLAKTLRERKLRGDLESDRDSADEGLGLPVQSTELWIDVFRGLSKLPTRERRALEEIYLRGLSYEQAAEALGLSLRQIKRLQHRGLATLRAVLGAQA